MSCGVVICCTFCGGLGGSVGVGDGDVAAGCCSGWGALFRCCEVCDLGVFLHDGAGECVEYGACEFVNIRSLRHGVVAVFSPCFGARHSECEVDCYWFAAPGWGGVGAVHGGV